MTTFKFEKLSLIQRDRPIIQGCFGDENIGNKPSWIECEYLRGELKGNSVAPFQMWENLRWQICIEFITAFWFSFLWLDPAK